MYVDYHDSLLRSTKLLPHENHPLHSDEYMFLENVFLVLYPNPELFIMQE